MSFQLGGFLLIMALGFVFGRLAEQRHLKSIIARELEFNRLPVVATRFPPEDQVYSQVLVRGSVVISSDYFKSFVAGLVNFFGGAVTTFEGLLDRARRESILRMKHQADELGARYVFNVKFTTMRLGVGGPGALEVFVYGTALVPANTIAAVHAPSTSPGDFADAAVGKPGVSG